MRALFTAATGMEAQQVRIDNVANNLANVNTTGFKKSRADFQDLFYETLRAPGAGSAGGAVLPTGAQVGHGVKLAAVTRNYSQGDRSNTQRDLDVAIDGDGFLQFEDAAGQTVYSRDGSLHLNQNGDLVSAQGLALVPSINIPSDALQITITDDGTVSTLTAGDTDPTEQGQIQLARFINPAGLRALGNNLAVPSTASGDPEIGSPNDEGFGSVTQGFLESSNVNIAEELVRMIISQRAFEVNSRVIQAGDEMLRTAAGLSA